MLQTEDRLIADDTDLRGSNQGQEHNLSLQSSVEIFM